MYYFSPRVSGAGAAGTGTTEETKTSSRQHGVCSRVRHTRGPGPGFQVGILKGLEQLILGWKVCYLKYNLDKSLSGEM